MARPLRHLIENGWYHVFGRGWERRDVFVDVRDREHFLELLEGLTDRYRFVIHAYALMDNHHHLIVQTPDANLSQGMQWFNTSYSAWFNARHDRVGSLWQGRYRDVLIENSGWAYALSLYVHLNPLRISDLGLDKHGRMIEAKGYRTPGREEVTERLRRLRTYRWSSYRAYAGYCTPPPWLTTEALWRRAHKDPARQPTAYRAEIRERLTRGVDPAQVERLRDVIAVGSATFAAHVRVCVGPDLEVTHRRELRRRCSEEALRKAVEKIRGLPWNEFAQSPGDWGRSLYLWGVRRYCGASLRSAGARTGGLKPSAVAMALQRWKQHPDADAACRRLQELLHQPRTDGHEHSEK